MNAFSNEFKVWYAKFREVANVEVSRRPYLVAFQVKTLEELVARQSFDLFAAMASFNDGKCVNDAVVEYLEACDA